MVTIRVLIADDQEMVRSGLRLIIDRRSDLHVVAETADGAAAITAAREFRPDVIVMDVRMPGIGGVEATRRICAEWPPGERPPRILILSTFDLDEYVYTALRSGASGFLLKNSTPDQLVDAIRVVARGEAMLAPSITHRLIRTFAALPPALLVGVEPDPPPQSDLAALTAKETEVLILVAKGWSNAQIAEDLGLTEMNVKSRVNRVLTRLGLDNRVQAAILAYSSGLLRTPGDQIRF